MRLNLVASDGQKRFSSDDGFAQAVYFNWNRINEEVNFNSYDAGNANANYSAPSLQGLLDSLNSE